MDKTIDIIPIAANKSPPLPSFDLMFSIVLNLFYSTLVNAAYGIAHQINSQIMFFSQTMMSTIKPQIMKSEGANDRERMIRLALTANKFSFYLFTIFAVPLFFEMPFILKLWLVEVPKHTVEFCRAIILLTMMNQINKGKLVEYSRHEVLDFVVIEGKTRGVIARNLITGEIERHAAHAIVLGTGGFGKIFYLSTLAMNSNGSATWRAHKKGALFANPSWTQIHPTALPQSGEHQSKLTLMSESLRNDGRIWVPKNKDESRKAIDVPIEDRDYYLERKYPSFGNLSPRDIASRGAKEACDNGLGIMAAAIQQFNGEWGTTDHLGFARLK